MKIEFNIETQAVPESNLNQALYEIEDYLLASTKARFNTMTAPDGTAWQPLSPAYYAVKPRNKNLILTLNGYLRRSIYSIRGEDTVTIGSNISYAGTHQYGYGRIPARPFIGLSENDNQFIQDTLSEWAVAKAEGLLSRVMRRIFSF